LAKARVKDLAEEEQRVIDEVEALRKSEAEYLNRIKETEARLPAHQEALRQAAAQAQRQADEEIQRLSQLEAVYEKARAEATERASREHDVSNKLGAIQNPLLPTAEEEYSQGTGDAEARLREQQEARQIARARVQKLAEEEQRVIAELEALRRSEAEYLSRIKEAEARRMAHQEALRQAEEQAQQIADEEAQKLSQLEAVNKKAQADSAQHAVPELSFNEELESIPSSSPVIDNFEVVLDPEVEALELPIEENVNSITPYEESTEEPWLTIDFDSKKSVTSNDRAIVAVETTADLLSLENIVAEPEKSISVAKTVADDAIPAEIAERLQSANSSQRAAALVDLAEAGGEESFALITKSFDDPSVEVRNAAARALSSLQPDLAASFTRALREASAERRRKIGAAIAASGLAANAINSLTGESRERTYSAFSILFLMAKAGEVQPLMQAIAKHPNTEVRLTSVKLLSLSNQHQILPGLRALASRDALPPEVHTAVMEAIYQLSNQSREVA
jgi:hypothetical protein